MTNEVIAAIHVVALVNTGCAAGVAVLAWSGARRERVAAVRAQHGAVKSATEAYTAQRAAQCAAASVLDTDDAERSAGV